MSPPPTSGSPLPQGSGDLTAPGPAFLAKGFRPFFLLAAMHAVLAVPLWVAILGGLVPAGTWLDPVQWHAHEMIFGFTTAVIAGFLLTAASNWTGRDTAVGPWLAALALLWIAGRVATATPGLPAPVVAGLDLAFTPALAFAIGRPILLRRSKRNYVFIALLGALFLANLSVHLDALGLLEGGRRRGNLLAVDVVVMVVLVVAGRIVPLFTRNATKAEGIASIPWLDWSTLAGMAAVIGLDALVPAEPAVAWLAGLVGLLALLRAARWGTRHTLRDPLLWVLHVGYLWVPTGLLLRAASSLDVLSPTVALHALTAGGIGTLTLGMMTRVSLGHTGRPLRASPALGGAFAILTAGALVRVIGAATLPAHYPRVLEISGTLWAAAFAIYLVSLAPALVSPRPDGRSG